MKTILEKITPAIAEKYLMTMLDNRNVRQPWVEFLADQMRAGLWRITHQGAAFDENGHLVDGQHRMWAVIFSNVTIEMNITRGVSRADVSVIDTNAPRTYSDKAHFEGRDKDPVAAAIARILVIGPGNYRKTLPFEVVANWREHYKEQIDLALQIRQSSRSRGKVITTGMAAAFARASFVIKPTILERMGVILGNGMVDDQKEGTAIVLRDAWIGDRIGRLVTEQYLKTEGAIRAFADRRVIRNLQRPEGELWEIPPLPKALRYEPKPANKAATQRMATIMAATTTVQ